MIHPRRHRSTLTLAAALAALAGATLPLPRAHAQESADRTGDEAPSVERVLASITREPANEADIPELPVDVASTLDYAIAVAEADNFEGAWNLVRDAHVALEREALRHPALHATAARIAELQRDQLRAVMFRRRALDLDHADEESRRRLALSVAAGARAEADDAWVLARALEGDPFPPRERVLIYRALAGLLEAADRSEDAATLRAEADRLADGVVFAPLPGDAGVREDPAALALSLAETVDAISDDPLALPQRADELMRTARDLDALAHRVLELEPSPESAALHAMIICELGRSRRADGALRTALADHPDHPALLASRARSLHLLGAYEALRGLGASQPTDTAQRNELAALLLSQGADHDAAADRARRALDATDAVSEPGAFVRRAMLGARVAVDRGEPGDASALLMRAHRADPKASAPLRSLVELHEPAGSKPSVEIHTMASSRLLSLENDPHDAAVLRATDALRRGYADIAEGLLLKLAEARPDDPTPARAVVRLWTETDRTQRAIDWLDAWVERRPALSHHRVLLADLYRERRRLRTAVDMLERWYDDNPGDMIVASRLEILYGESGASEQAERLALRRLKRLPDSLERMKERVMILARLGDPADLDEELDRLLPHAQRMREDLGPWSVEIFTRLLREVSRRRPGERDVTPVIVRLHAGVEGTPFEADALAIRALASGHRDTRVVTDAARRAMLRHPDRAHELALDGAAALLTSARSVATLVARDERAPGLEAQIIDQRRDAATDLAERAVIEALSADAPGYGTEAARTSARVLGQALRLAGHYEVAVVRPNHHIRAIFDALLDLEDPVPALVAFADPASVENPDRRTELDMQDVGEAFHRLSLTFTYPGAERGDHYADAIADLALTIAPHSPEINNDYGYRLAERGERLEDAERMTLLAVRSIPDNYSFLDSLAWTRYKRGAFTDDVQARERGAIELLLEATRRAQMVGDQSLASCGVLFDHLGDALWAAGDREAAVKAWDDASAYTRRYLDRLSEVEPDTAVDDAPVYLRDRIVLAHALRAKLAAAEAGREPPIAPPHGPGFTADDIPARPADDGEAP